MDLKPEETASHMVDRFDLQVWDISHALDVLDSIPLRSFAMLRYIEMKGLNPDHARIWTEDDSMGQELRVVRERVLDDFIVFTINTFEFCFITRPELTQLTEKERRFFLDCHDARSYLYRTIKLNPELAGRFIRYQRIGKSIYLITPKP